METTLIDFTSVADTLFMAVSIILGTVASVGIAWLSKKLNDKFGLEIEGQHREALQDAFGYAINFGINRAKEAANGRLTFDSKNSLVAFAVTYLMQQVPGTLKTFGIDPNTPEGQHKIATMVEARLVDYVFDETPVMTGPKLVAGGEAVVKDDVDSPD